jgi:hypothetical protein
MSGRHFDSTENAELRAKMRTSASDFSSALSLPEYVRVRVVVSVSSKGPRLRKSKNEQ